MTSYPRCTMGSFTAEPCGTYQVGDENGSAWAVIPGVRRADAPRGTSPGNTSGLEVLDKAQITVPVLVKGTSASDAYTNTETLRGYWAPSNADLTLSLEYDASVKRAYFGRPDPAGPDLLHLFDGRHAAALCTFWAMDPLAYGDEVTVTGAGTFTVAGTATTERLVVTVHGNGGTPQITNPNGTFLKWGSAVTGTRVADCRARTVVNGSTNALAELQAYQEWLTLSPGSNVLTVTGCASIDITYRPAYA